MLRAKVLQDLAHEKSQHEVLKLKFFEMKAQRQWLGERLDESERLLDLHDSNVEYKDTQISQLRHELAEERRRRQTTEEYTTRMETELFQASVANENLRGSEDEHRVSALKLTLQVMMKEAQIVKESFAKCRQDMANYARSIYINADDWAAFRAFFQTHQSSQEQQDDELRNMARRLGENLQLMNEAISQVFLLTNVKQSQHRLDPTSSQGALQKRSSTSVANSWRPVKRPCLSTVRDGALLGSTPNESFFFHYEKYRHPVSSTKSARNSGPRKILQEDEAELNWWQQQERQALFEDFAVAEARMGIDALHLPPSHPNPDIYNNPGWHGVGHLSFNTSPGSSDDGKDEDSAEYIPPYEERFEWGQNGIRLIREEQSLEIVQVRTGLEWLELELKSASPSALPLAWQQTILGSPRKRVQFSEKYTIAEHDDESPVPRKRQRTNEYPSSFTTYPQSALKGFLGHPEKVANHTEVANSIPPKLPTWQRDIPLLPFRSFGTQTNEEIQDPTALRYRLRSKPKVPTQSHAKHERKHRKLRRLSKSNPYLQVPKFIRKMPGAWPVSPRATTKTSSPQSHKSPSQRFKDTLTRVAPILAGTAAVAATFWGLKQLNAYDKWIDSNDLYNGSVSGSLNSRFSDVGWMEYKLTKWLGLDRTLLG
ncbi:hypothetical protein N7462_003387 [Penicillium macrosclerotiorum]|uniref:uncharacterized protein n=1 Tax=Penicillium macrosclerotiorum TaxID=303699 RepID=UPI00254872A0|nr:uncharacterized protein N7462_003387 [Penicillium macrosclerotiorum]KAJ5688995.1 hypothetical protein N7462_003387 [Penicillium macrosclerotiorum]